MREQINSSFFFLNFFGFLLIAEWIWPIQTLSSTAEVRVFLIFLGFCLILSFFRLPLLFNICLKGGIILYLLHKVYFEGSFFRIDWISPFLFEMMVNIEMMTSGDFIQLTNLFRSGLFFILLAILVYLLHYWLVRQKKMFMFVLLTVFYITILDTFTPYDASNAMVRTVIIGFILIGALTYQRLLQNGKVKMKDRAAYRWMISLVAMVVLSSAISYGIPKADPIWPDPVSFIKVLDERDLAGLQGAKRVGYGTDDSHLGGPVMGDPSVVFTTKVQSAHYWKVETKDVYTGKGWLQSEKKSAPVSFTKEGEVPLISTIDTNAVESVQQTSYVTQMKEYTHIIYPFGIKTIDPMEDYTFQLDPSIEKIHSLKGSDLAVVPEYSITFEKPKYSLKALQSAGVNNSHLSQEFMAQYTQLPRTLPKRVENLAVEITAGKTSWYDKALAIQQYLKGPDFSYDLQNVATPGAREDYVDQFLFESMIGYCNNFSTSMVVMLRAIDIPARWVKGYTEGEYVDFQNRLYEYEVTNNNAHAWVEVYFPQVGWVSFDPTPGFTNGIDYHMNEDALEESLSVSGQDQEEQTDGTPIETTAPTVDSPYRSLNTKWETIKSYFSSEMSWIYLVMIVLFVAGAYLYKTRMKWLSRHYIRKFNKSPHRDSFVNAYITLLKQLERSGLKRGPGQTLREYATEVDEYFSTEHMTLLTIRYEKYLYGEGLENDNWEDVREFWENLIKHSAS